MVWAIEFGHLIPRSSMHSLPDLSTRLEDQPVERIEIVGNLYFRSVLLKKRGTSIPQHSHDHDHATLVCSGAARVWIGGVYHGDFEAGHAVEIKAGRQHVFQALEANTRLCCVHDVASAESVKAKGI